MVSKLDGPTHAYMLSATGCWERYGSLEDWKAGLGGDDGIDTVQDLVDSYAAQHATNVDRRNRQSVAVHLMSLCARLEMGLTGRERRSGIGIWVGRDYPALDPRPAGYSITVADIARTPEPARPSAVGRMAVSTWSAWAVHHGTIRRWLEGQA
jgi:hypothetical protein